MTTPALLPLSGRRIPPRNLGPSSSFPHHRATLRLSEKFILLLILSAFITLCFGAFFFLPDSSKHKRFDLGLEDVLIPHVDTSDGGKNPGGFLIHGQGHDQHRHSCFLLLSKSSRRHMYHSLLSFSNSNPCMEEFGLTENDEAENEFESGPSPKHLQLYYIDSIGNLILKELVEMLSKT